jgi:hypothetical protein
MSALKALEGVDARVDAYKLRGERMDGRIVGEPEEVRKRVCQLTRSLSVASALSRVWHQEVNDPAQTRALRAVRHDPLWAPEEPLRVTVRAFDARDASDDFAVVLQRELSTVSDGRGVVAQRLGVPVPALRLVLRGIHLEEEGQLLWDLGLRHPRETLYYQTLREDGSWR